MKLICRILLAATLTLAATAAPAGKPNIIFIFTDDQAVDTIAASKVWGVDASVIHTPNMDRLVSEGTRFSNAYNMGAWTGAVCVSSRSMLNTGRFLWHSHNAEKNNYTGLLKGGRFWSQRMKTAGYETYMSGKWHVEAPVENLFDHSSHVRLGMPPFTGPAYNRPIEGKQDGWLPWDESNGGYWAGGKHWSEVLADDAEKFIGEAAGKGKPFFMYLAFNAPHDPRQSPKSFVDMYPLDKIPLPENFLPLNEHHQAMGLGPTDKTGMRDEALAPFPRTGFAVKTHRREYDALITHLDVQIGRILDALDRAKVSDNTYVIFTSDHGLAIGRHGLMGKQNMYEHSLRVPFVIRGPGIPNGGIRDARIYMQDAMATSLDLAGADMKDLEFKSIMPMIKDAGKSQHDAIYGAFGQNSQRAVIAGDHKMILYPATKTILLFDLSKDPLEMHDLAGMPASTVLEKQLFARLRDLQKQTGDQLDLSRTYPHLAE